VAEEHNLPVFQPEKLAQSDELAQLLQFGLSGCVTTAITSCSSINISNTLVEKSGVPINITLIELTAYDDVARMILHIVDQMNGIPFTKRAQHLLTDHFTTFNFSIYTR
jgi:peptide deformylase